MGEQCGGSLADFIGLNFGSYMDPYAFYCHLLRCAKPLCYGSAYCSNLCLCVTRIHIAVSKLLIENPSCYFDAFGKFLIFLNQVLRFVVIWCWLFWDEVKFGFCFSRYFLLFIFFQPCPARVAVPCPSAFAPGKFVLVHHESRYSVIRNSGTADQFVLWGSPSWLPSTFMTWCISWFSHFIVHVVHVLVLFYQTFIFRLFPASWTPSLCHLWRRDRSCWSRCSCIWYSCRLCGIPQDAS